MAELKTKVNDADARDFINAVADEAKKRDGLTLLDLFIRVTGQPPKMWGASIIGFGQYHYKSERSSQEGDWPLTGFSPRKAALTLYIGHAVEQYSELLKSLGKHKTGKGCLYINKLSDVDMKVLESIIRRSFEDMKQLYPS